jgi:hypothetical protein
MWYENYLKVKDMIVEVLEKLITDAEGHYIHCP